MRTVASQQTKMPATHIQLIPADIDYDDIFLLVRDDENIRLVDDDGLFARPKWAV